MDVEALIRAVDALEDGQPGYLTREQVEATVGRSIEPEIASDIVLVDYRARLDGQRVILCRLNRHHPAVRRLTDW